MGAERLTTRRPLLRDVYDPACTACALHESAKTVCMPAHGGVQYAALIVGEAPGRDEDAAGRPFIGRAGEVLNRALIQAFITEHARAEIMVTNAVKCRPPANRKPTPLEIDTCVSLYLVDEVAALDPIAILALGNTAIEGLLGVTGISSLRGQWYLLDRPGETWVMPTWHPAYVLRNPSAFAELLSDTEDFANKIIAKSEVPL